jgi:hypothetical protein
MSKTWVQILELQKKKKKKNEEVGVVHAFGQEVEKGRSPSEDSPGKSMRPYLKR